MDKQPKHVSVYAQRVEICPEGNFLQKTYAREKNAHFMRAKAEKYEICAENTRFCGTSLLRDSPIPFR